MISYVTVLLFGAVIGSFLNVCIYRLPREESVAWPASHCPSCRQAIAFYDNIPIVSYLLLRGRCRACHAPIAIQYPVVEAANAIGYVLVFWTFGFAPAAWAYAALASALIVVTGTDLSHTMIPDAVTLPGIVIGLLCAILILPIGLVDSLLGVLLGGGILWFLAWISPYVFGMMEQRLALPHRSPMPLIVPCTCRMPDSTATSEFATAISLSLCA